MLAHELRNPLAPICTGLDLIQRQYADSEDHADTLRLMDRQLGHLVRLVDDLLDFSRIGQGKVRLRLERHTIAEIVDAALFLATGVLRSGSTLFIDSGQHLLDQPRDVIWLAREQAGGAA
jgi:K+-sensing histidine kinase KdpD